MIDPNHLLAIVGIISAIGGAGITAGATRQRIKTVEQDLARHDQRTNGFGERLGRIETNIEWIKRKLSE